MQRGINKTAPPCTGGAAGAAIHQISALLPAETMMMMAVTVLVARIAS